MRYLITGACGFIGRHVCRLLEQRGFKPNADFFRVSSRWDEVAADIVCDLTVGDCELSDAIHDVKPDAVLHFAGWNGSIQMNSASPGDIFRRNTLMALNVLEGCVYRGSPVKKVVSLVASCGYPTMDHNDRYGSFGREVMQEAAFLDGPPHETVACHAYAKRNLFLASQFYRQQYNLNAVCLCPSTVYGPGDSFDPHRTKVVGAMVKRFVDAERQQLPSVTCWGTGSPLRELLYVEDCARLILGAAEHCNEPLLNLGGECEVSVKELAELVAEEAGYCGNILWDETKPDGQFRKHLDTSLRDRILPPSPLTPLREGICRTIEYYRGLS